MIAGFGIQTCQAYFISNEVKYILLIYHFMAKEIQKISLLYITWFIQPVRQVLQTLPLMYTFLKYIQSTYHIYTKIFIYFDSPSIPDNHFYNFINHSDSQNSNLNYSLDMTWLHQFEKPFYCLHFKYGDDYDNRFKELSLNRLDI